SMELYTDHVRESRVAGRADRRAGGAPRRGLASAADRPPRVRSGRRLAHPGRTELCALAVLARRLGHWYRTRASPRRRPARRPPPPRRRPAPRRDLVLQAPRDHARRDPRERGRAARDRAALPGARARDRLPQVPVRLAARRGSRSRGRPTTALGRPPGYRRWHGAHRGRAASRGGGARLGGARPPRPAAVSAVTSRVRGESAGLSRG